MPSTSVRPITPRSDVDDCFGSWINSRLSAPLEWQPLLRIMAARPAVIRSAYGKGLCLVTGILAPCSSALGWYAWYVPLLFSTSVSNPLLGSARFLIELISKILQNLKQASKSLS